SQGMRVRLWDAQTGRFVKEVALLDRAGQPVRAAHLAFTPDSTLLAVGDQGGVVHLYNVEKGMRVGELPARKDGRAVSALAFSPGHAAGTGPAAAGPRGRSAAGRWARAKYR